MGGGSPQARPKEQVRQVFPGMLVAGFEEGDGFILQEAYNAGCKDPLAVALRIPFFEERQHLHGGIVIVDDLALGGPLDQRVINRREEHARGIQDIPLGGSRQRIAQVLLKVFQPVERHAAAVFQERQHGHRRVVETSDP